MPIDTGKAQLDEQGFVLLENVITGDQADALRDLSMFLARQEREAGRGHMYLDDRAQRVLNLVNKGEVFERAIQDLRVLNAMESLLGEGCTLSSFTVNIIRPEAANSNPHIDYPLGSMPIPRPSFPLCANSVWFFDHFTLDNGATRCIPGSHRSPTGVRCQIQRRSAD